MAKSPGKNAAGIGHSKPRGGAGGNSPHVKGRGVNDPDRAGDKAESGQPPCYDGNAELEKYYEDKFDGDS
jgi:hypothetical protein